MKKQIGIKQIINGTQSSDGDGVQLSRFIASPELDILDPFLLFDVFGSDTPKDYIGGFPSHPHRGFETVTYMLAGKMRHQDSEGNSGVIKPGGVQWMRAGSGIIHSEMPEQEDGLLAGCQLWVNLPATHKMSKPSYQEYAIDDIPMELRGDTASLKLIAGKTKQGIQGIIKHDVVAPIYWDISLSQGSQFVDVIPKNHNAFIYVIEGDLIIEESSIMSQQLAVLFQGEQLKVNANSDSRFLLIAGKPLNEPVARGGHFVMNTKQEVQQAFTDYKEGKLTNAL